MNHCRRGVFFQVVEISFCQNKERKKKTKVSLCHSLAAREREELICRETEGRRAKRQAEEQQEMKKRNANERRKEKTESQTNWFSAVGPFEC